MPPIVALTTDFGLRDGYVAQMHGVILAGSDARIVDVTHEVPPQDVVRAAFLLDDVVDAFPPETIHVVVVDPGVGTDRAIIAVETPRGRFVCPDNGLLGVVLEGTSPTRVIRCTDPAWWRPDISRTFHGRDVMAPLAAHWASGVDSSRFGPVCEALVPLPTSTRPDERDGTLHGRVLWADHFGNLVTNIRRVDLDRWSTAPSVWIGDVDVGPVRATYGEIEADGTLALVGSGGRLEISVNRGSAAERFGWSCGDEREVVVTGVSR